ncbi:MAG: hypothetical protein J7L32_02490 [Thermoplasmata archaeon]|nr:hypothetical protein [Thermoplasmata archaeon]
MVLGAADNKKNPFENVSVSLSKPNFDDKGNYISVELKEATSKLMEPGKPVVPVVTKTLTFPLGTKLLNVNVNVETERYTLDKKVEPAPKPMVLDGSTIYEETGEDQDVYGSTNLYPSNQYTVETGAGLKDGEHVLYLNIRCYTQYSPANNLLYVPENINIDVSYQPPNQPLFDSNQYDLLIITDEKFVPNLQPLVDHKNSIGIKTKMETTQYIYSHYNGRDKPEDIKLFIKDALEQWGIKYVLLAGGRKGQTFDWYIPERRSNNNADMESGYASDLYYGDIYRTDHAGNVWFEDWDWNDNGIFAEAEQPSKIIDKIDYYPDVYVGRLPIRYSWEADVIVNKIITYENTADDSWFKTAFVAGGDTSPPARAGSSATLGVYEGELTTGLAADYMEASGFNVSKLWTSLGTFTGYEDIVNAFNKGPGMVYFAGHGNPGVWGNFLPDAETEAEFALGFTVFDIWKYNNQNHLPIVVIGGCHNAQFNITMQHIVTHNQEAMAHGEFYPQDGASWMLLEEGGGSIASIGYTGYGYGYINQYCLAGLGGWIEPRFFYEYTQAGKEYLGEAHGQAISDYITLIGGVNSDLIDRKTVESWALLGDPSLKIGGVGTKQSSDSNTEQADTSDKTPFSINPPTWNEGMRWTYKISNIDFTLDEIEGRYIDVHVKTGDFNLQVAEVTSDAYRTEFTISDADIRLNINLDLDANTTPIVLSGNVSNANLNGNIYWDKGNLGLKEIDARLTGVLDLTSLPIDFSSMPKLIQKLLEKIPFEFTLNLQATFNESYPLLKFPLTNDESWGLPPVEVTVDGTIESKWFKVANILNKIAGFFGKDFIPPELASLLPVIRISKVLNMYNVSNQIDIPEIWDPLYHDIHMFKCSTQKTVTVEAGTYNSQEISMVRGIGQIFYSPEVANIVKIQGNFNDILPIVEDVSMELVNVG